MSSGYFEKVDGYLADIDVEIVSRDEGEGLFVVDNESRGIHNLIIDCEEELLVLEQVIFVLKSQDPAILRQLLTMNRELVHGAFALDEENRVLFRDTLQLSNLDPNELEASINALALALATYADDLIGFAAAA